MACVLGFLLRARPIGRMSEIMFATRGSLVESAECEKAVESWKACAWSPFCMLADRMYIETGIERYAFSLENAYPCIHSFVVYTSVVSWSMSCSCIYIYIHTHIYIYLHTYTQMCMYQDICICFIYTHTLAHIVYNMVIHTYNLYRLSVCIIIFLHSCIYLHLFCPIS